MTTGGSCETRKLRNADYRAHVPTLYVGARGVQSFVARALLAACCAHDGRVVGVANCLPSTVADCLLSAVILVFDTRCLLLHVKPAHWAQICPLEDWPHTAT